MPRGPDHLLSFSSGALIGALGLALVALHVLADYEDHLFDQIVSSTIEPDWSDQKKLVVLTAVAHDDIFGGKNSINIHDWLGQWLVQDGLRDCGTYSGVLGRLLDRAGIGFRIAQMYCPEEGVWGCHITLEAKVNGGWLAVDPLYNIVFPVSYEEVGRNWDKYKRLTPSNYDEKYRYAGVRYTNWNKIPIVLPATKWLLDFVAPEFARTLSLRSYFLNLYRVYEFAGFFLILVVGFLLLRARAKQAHVELTENELRACMNERRATAE